jgi:hypothetical protein
MLICPFLPINYDYKITESLPVHTHGKRTSLRSLVDDKDDTNQTGENRRWNSTEEPKLTERPKTKTANESVSPTTQWIAKTRSQQFSAFLRPASNSASARGWAEAR